TKRRSGAHATGRNKPGTQYREEECHDEVPKHEPREISLKIGFRSEKRRHFVMRALHQHPVPNEAKHEKENEGCDECEEEFFPVHKMFLSGFSLRAGSPESLIAKPLGDVDLKFLSASRSRENDE